MDGTDGPGLKDSRGGRDLEVIEASLVQRYSASLEAFLEEVSAALTELEQERLPLTASMKKRPDEILSMLPQVLSFEQMSFLEVRYALPGTAKKRPGIRFWLEGPLREKRLRAILFEDTAVWNVSYDLVKLYTELGTFFLQGTEIVGCPAAALSAGSGTDVDWKVLLRTVLRAPLP